MPRRSRPDPLALAVGRRIRAIREEKEMTQEEVAFRSVGKGALSNLEAGLARPTINSLARIAEALEVPMAILLCFPERGEIDKLMDLVRRLPPGTRRKWLKDASVLQPPKSGNAGRR